MNVLMNITRQHIHCIFLLRRFFLTMNEILFVDSILGVYLRNFSKSFFLFMAVVDYVHRKWSDYFDLIARGSYNRTL